MAFTVQTVIKDIMSLWGIENPDASIPDARNRAMSDLNKAVQMLWQNPEKLGYFSRKTESLTISAGNDYVAVTGIQNICGPIRRGVDNVPLFRVMDRSEFERFPVYYLGVDALADDDLTIACYLDEQASVEADSLADMKILVLPKPIGDVVIKVDWLPNAPTYTWTDYCADDGGTVIPIPHGYGESLLLPIARKSAMSYFLFFKEERVPLIENEYQTARAMLGLADPEMDEGKPEPKPVPPLNPPRGQ